MITQSRLKELLIYDPLTGIFINKVDRRDNPIGTVAGAYYESSGNAGLLGLEKEVYKMSSLAWLYMTGAYPDRIVDHIDTNPDNNRWSNLRLATISENSCNRKRRIDCSSGIKGLYYNTKYSRYEVSININGKRHNTTFGASKKEEAIAWLRAKREELHQEFCNHGNYV